MPEVEFIISGIVIAAGSLNFKACNNGIPPYCHWSLSSNVYAFHETNMQSGILRWNANVAGVGLKRHTQTNSVTN